MIVQNISQQKLEKNKISIVITSYNQKEFLDGTIESALNQSLKPYEIVIADDCSTDGSVELITRYAKKYPDIIKPILHKSNLGVAKNRTSGFKKAKGDLITWANGDDILLPCKLELELKTYLNNPEARWVYSQVVKVDALGRRTGILRYRGKYEKKTYTFKDIATKIGKEPAYQLIDRSILGEVGLFDEDLEIYEDWDFAIRLAKKFKFAYCPTPLYGYRMNLGGLSKAHKETHLKAIKKVYQKVLPLLEDIPEKEAKVIKKILKVEIYRIDAEKRLEEGKRFLAGRFLVKAIKNNPLKTYLYKLFAQTFFPNKVVNILKRLRKTVK